MNPIVRSYANLIIKGIKTIEDVPQALRQAVQDYLADQGYTSDEQ